MARKDSVHDSIATRAGHSIRRCRQHIVGHRQRLRRRAAELLERVEAATSAAADAHDRLAYVRAVDQAIAERHHAGLRYPPKLLVRGLEEALAGLPVERAARTAWRSSLRSRLADERVAEIEQAFFVDLSCAPKIRSGVREGLETLRAANCLVLIVSEGARAKVEKTTKRLGLDRLVARIIEGQKRPELYRRVLRFTGAPKRAFMVGDQLDRDIAPAKAAGLEDDLLPRWLSAALDHGRGESSPGSYRRHVRGCARHCAGRCRGSSGS